MSGQEYERVELPLVRQLVSMGWSHVEGQRSDPPVATGRESFAEVLLLERLRSALRRINRDEQGREWLDEGRIGQAISQLMRPRATSLVEVNQELTELLLLGATVDGVEGWDGGRLRTVHFIDWDPDHVDRNDFLVINQFRVDPPGDEPSIYPDAVLFVNGIPLVVVEAKSPTASNRMGAAIEQLRRYANQRGAVEPEGSERLFATNQFVIGTCFDEAKVGTFTAEAEHYGQWKTTTPVPEAEVAAGLGVTELSSQQRLVAGMLHPARLLDLVRHFTLWMPTDDGRVIKVIARYQQYRAVRATVDRLVTGATRVTDGEHDRRGGVVWHTQGSGKSLTMVFLVRVMRSHPDLVRFKVVVVTDRKQLQAQLAATARLTGETVAVATRVAKAREQLAIPGKALIFVMIQKYRNPDADREDDAELKSLGELDASTDVLVIVDEAHRSHSSTLHAALRKALPNAARVGFTGTPIIMGDKPKTHAIFGAFLDRYDIRQSEIDGATVPILYEGRTTKGGVRDADDIEEFIDLYGLTPEQTEVLKQRYATKRHVAEARQLIEAKAANMLRHYVDVVLPNGFKAQVVATSRVATLRYREAFLAARDRLVAQLDALDEAWRTEEARDRAERLPAKRALLVRAWPRRDVISRLDFIPVISGAQNDAPELARWTSGHERAISDFKKKLPTPGEPAADGSTVAMLIVNAMLLTGFDAPEEQVIYLDRALREADLLQAIARVNRTAPRKPCGYVVDYYGVAHHLTEALEAYAADDIGGALTNLNDELPRLAAAHAALRQIFPDAHDLTSVPVQDECVQDLADERLRARFDTALKAFTSSLEIVLPSEKALPFVGDAKAFGTIALLARRRYRDPALFDPRGYGQKVRDLIDTHVQALDISVKIPPISITAADYAEKVSGLPNARAKASEMEHAIRHHISERMDTDPTHYQRLSEHLERILAELKDQWEQLAVALTEFLPVVAAGRGEDPSGLDPHTQAPFHDLIAADLADHGRPVTPERAGPLRQATLDVLDLIRDDIRMVGFWDNAHKRRELRGAILHRLDQTRMEDGSDLFDFDWLGPLADRLIELAKHHHRRLTNQP